MNKDKSTDRNGANQLILEGDFSIVGVDEQLPILLQYLARAAAIAEAGSLQDFSREIDLTGLQILDACGCQLLAVFFRKLRQIYLQRDVERFALKVSDVYRQNIHFLGFADDFFGGESL